MHGEFPQQFKCPICFEIPEKEIFQCQNGHTFCDTCAQSLSVCSQCRVSLGTSKIRSRPLEELLDMMTFNCSYKQEGCSTKVSRKEVTSHSKSCSFRGERVPLCKYLGYTCGYILNTKKLQEYFHHLKHDHQSLFTNETSLEVKLRNIKELDREMRCLWKPILINNFNSHYLLVIWSYESNVLFTCISMVEEVNKKVQIKFHLVTKKDSASALEWTTKPFLHLESEAMLRSPPLQIPLSLLVEQYLDEENLTLQVRMTNSNTFRNGSKVSLDLDSFVVIQPHQLDLGTQLATQQSDFGFAGILAVLQIDKRFASGAICNVCKNDLIGLRFKCLECSDFDLCIQCLKRNEHSFHHFAILYTKLQVNSIRAKCRRSERWQPYVYLPEVNGCGDLYGSALNIAKDLHCHKCTKRPYYICLQCGGPFGLCKLCFVSEMYTHNSGHFFALTPTNTAREFVVYVLHKQTILKLLKPNF